MKKKSFIDGILDYKMGLKHEEYKAGYLNALNAFDNFIAFVDKSDKEQRFVYDKEELKHITNIIRSYIKEIKK